MRLLNLRYYALLAQLVYWYNGNYIRLSAERYVFNSRIDRHLLLADRVAPERQHSYCFLLIIIRRIFIRRKYRVKRIIFM